MYQIIPGTLTFCRCIIIDKFKLNKISYYLIDPKIIKTHKNEFTKKKKKNMKR